MTISKQFPTLVKLVDRQEKRIEKFQDEASKFFHPHAVTLCERIRKGIPEFTGCKLAMRLLFLEPRDLKCIKVENIATGETNMVRLRNLNGYIDRDPDVKSDWKLCLPQDTITAFNELDAMANYIDDSYSMVSSLEVTLKPKKKK